MAVQCPRCRRQYDVTLFQFRHHIRCVCGARLDLDRGHAIETAAAPPARLILVCPAEADAAGALTGRGRRQAAALAERLHDEDVAAVYAGEAPACRQTGRALAEGLGLALQATALLDAGSADRVLAFLRALARWRPEAATLVVAEAGVCRGALAGVLGTGAERGGPAEAAPASVHVIVAEAAGWRVASVDDTAHLEARERRS